MRAMRKNRMPRNRNRRHSLILVSLILLTDPISSEHDRRERRWNGEEIHPGVNIITPEPKFILRRNELIGNDRRFVATRSTKHYSKEKVEEEEDVEG